MICYGLNPVAESLRSPWRAREILLQRGKDNPRIRGVLRRAEEEGIRVREVPDLTRLCRSPDHQGVAMDIDEPGHPELPDEVIRQQPRLVLFDSLRDPHNFGAALRVCDCYDFRHIVWYKGNSSGITASAIKVSAGAVFHVELYQSNLNNAVRRLREAGVSIVVLEADGESIHDFPLPERYCVVIGSEGEGVRHGIRRLADHVVRIPMHGKVNSLNVSCALTAALGEFDRRAGW